MELSDFAGMIVDGQAVYYKRDEVIAIGEEAARFMAVHPARLSDDGDESRDAEDVLTGDDLERLDRGVPRGASPLPSAFRFNRVADPGAVVAAAQSRGLRIQLNHVFFAHCGCGCDPCCASNMFGAMPLKATPLKATPLKATGRTTAVQAGQADDLEESASQPNVRVWILDTGVTSGQVPTRLPNRIVSEGEQEDHPDRDPSVPDKWVDPVAGHGTFIAGIIERITPGCSIHVHKVIDPIGHVTEQEVADKIHHLLTTAPIDGRLRRTILNLSFGGALVSDDSWYLSEAIATAQEMGVVVIASAGNDASCLPVYPGNFRGVTAVGAIDSDGRPASFTNRGSWVDACALGVDIVSAFFDFADEAAEAMIVNGLKPDFRGWAKWSGTSFATPVVVGAIAELLSQDEDMTAADARDAVLASGSLVPCLGVAVQPSRWRELLEGASSVS